MEGVNGRGAAQGVEMESQNMGRDLSISQNRERIPVLAESHKTERLY